MGEHPLDAGMDYPADGCDCSDCAYAQWFEALTPEDRARELDLLYAYEPDEE